MTSARISAPVQGRFTEILSPAAMDFLEKLQRQFGERRLELLERRSTVRGDIAKTGRLDFLPETQEIREDESWRVPPAPSDLADRRVEITGPTDAKMLINALNSGARVFMADFEDSNTPTWDNLIQGQLNLIDAIERRLTFTSPEGKQYAVSDRPAVLMIRPRGWHLVEKHVLIGDEPMSGSLFDFGLYFFHNAERLLRHGSGPYFYLPKIESYLEARLWNDVFSTAQESLDIPRGTIRATVLIETIPAAFQMEEILYELRDHCSGLNAGRWDYMFSLIKKFRDCGRDFVLPDRNSVTMTVPFMRAYTELLVSTSHRRGAFAMGGMAAFIPNRRDIEVNERALRRVRDDKEREAADGFDGTWVAHPDLVPVAIEVFDRVLGDRPNQLDRNRPEVVARADELLNVKATPGGVTEAGLRNNVSVGIQYLESWLRGTGAVAIFNLMEDAATAEIARSQIWQWLHNEVTLEDGEFVTVHLVQQIVTEELDKIRDVLGEEIFESGEFNRARSLFEQVTLADAFVDFLTLPAYEMLDEVTPA